MKIKCPLCEKQYNFKNWESLTDHWESSKHGYDYEPFMGDYAELIFKIHEKIELWELSTDKLIKINVLGELKSLLDNSL